MFIFRLWWWLECWLDCKALWRGERRLVSRGLRGRVYRRKRDSVSGLNPKAKVEARLSYKVYRAKTNNWYDEQGRVIPGMSGRDMT